MLGDDTRKRELRPLQAIHDNHEKLILSMDAGYVNSYEGIRSMSVIDFLLA